jgi:ABC-2 type transport system ATP-binding protein
MDVIQAEAIAKTYAGLFGRSPQRALQGVDLRIEAGRAFGLIGPNGAGKTTFIKILLGVVRPTAGTVKVMGEAPESLAARRQIGYLPERLYLPAAWSAHSFLCSVGRLKGLSNVAALAQAELVRVGLGPDAKRRVGGFSKGMRQRLGLAAALLGKPSLLILDEPTDGVDPLGRVEVRRILAEERARGATLFLNSHLLSETERVCDQVGILAHGKLVRSGTLEALCASTASWVVRFDARAEAEALHRAGFLPGEGGVWTFAEPDVEVLNRALDAARASGAWVTEVNRAAVDLEEVLASAVRSAA